MWQTLYNKSELSVIITVDIRLQWPAGEFASFKVISKVSESFSSELALVFRHLLTRNVNYGYERLLLIQLCKFLQRIDQILILSTNQIREDNNKQNIPPLVMPRYATSLFTAWAMQNMLTSGLLMLRHCSVGSFVF